jgi:ABC-type transport system involved in cytochrome c biogenesis permease subunit
MIIKTAKNKEHIDFNIKKISYINEMSLTLGLFLLTIGTFLGGVWANESWGRYWGWDPKETWALISMLVYAFVIHMRFIPGLRGFFAFNFASLLSISSVIMTYFGVNYYLSGLHSYASGDPVPIPMFVYYSLGVVLVISLFAFIKDKKLKN